MKKTVRERFEEKYKIMPSGCWEWQFGLLKRGYGKFKLDKKTIGSHRASYMIYKGEIDTNLCVCHKCDNPKCVNPEHLFLGTHKDNVNDSQMKGRRPLTPHPSESYYAQGCRCEECKKAHSSYMKKYEEKNRERNNEKRNEWKRRYFQNDENRAAFNLYKKLWRLKKKQNKAA